MTYVPDLDPPLQTLVIREDLHTGLCVRVVSRLEPQLVVSSFLEEGLHHRCHSQCDKSQRNLSSFSQMASN
jgi:hypothetical protein